jgi:hypothetical protein
MVIALKFPKSSVTHIVLSKKSLKFLARGHPVRLCNFARHELQKYITQQWRLLPSKSPVSATTVVKFLSCARELDIFFFA